MEAFADKLAFVLKALSLSRGRLGAELGVDKSIVSRWFSGAREPSANNLAALTALIASRRPGFSLLDWDRSLESLSTSFGVTHPGAGPPTADPPERSPQGLLTVSQIQSAQEIGREGHAYPGLYVGFRQVFRDTGEVAPDLLIIWREGRRLRFRHFDVAFSHTGEVLILRHQLFIVGEDDGRADGLLTYLLNGVVGGKAFRLDGLVMSVAGDSFRTPTATTTVLQRLADLEDSGAPPTHDDLSAIQGRLRRIMANGELAALAGPAIMTAIRPVVGAPGIDGRTSHLLRKPGDRSLSASDLDWTAALEADIRRVRERVLGGEPPLALSGAHALARTEV